MKPPLKICFVSLNSYPLFKIHHPGYFGGAELQMSLIAKKLAQDKRFSVSIIVADYGQKAVVKTNNLTIYLGFRKYKWLFWETIRFFWLLKKIKADVYIDRTMNIKVGLVALWCKLFKKKFIYMIAHDWDVQLNHGQYIKGFDKSSFDFGLTHADLIVAQTENQKLALKNNFGLKSVVVHSLAAKPARTQILSRRFFLWVGRADDWKRPEKFISLAKKLPKEKFVFICREGQDHQYFLRIKQLSKKITNLSHVTGVSFEDMANFFEQAKALVNTSIAEGFPNTFLQAGIARTPLISLKVNPDNFITKYNCGICVNNNFSQLVKACQNIKPGWGNNSFQYVKKYHSFKNASLFARVLLDHFGRPAA